MVQEPFHAVIEDTEAYRDHISTVDTAGKRIWLYPKKPKGRFYNARSIVTLVFLAFFLSMPFIKIDGEQFLLFNVLERKFVLFGILFTPQDFHLFVLAMLTFIVFIILFTVVFGRLFCGWVCPQTVFMEMIFRKIEYWIEGDAPAMRRLDNSPWTAEKIRKKTLKHLIFFGIAVVFANYFLAYIISMDSVLHIIRDPLSEHIGGFIAMLIFSGVFYFTFARMREQICTTICPYGRLQSVLLVKDSIVVAYDPLRGEPRGKLKKQSIETQETSANPIEAIKNSVGDSASSLRIGIDGQPKGDCIDCKLCVAVCPTGIDIRNGTQLECTNCTACIDACDEVMDKIHRPRGLVRYDSMTGIESGKRKIFTPRVWAYTAFLSALLILDVALLANRGSIESIILRAPGQLYQQTDDTHLTNLYSYVIINKTNKEMPFTMKAVTPGAVIKRIGQAHDNIPKSSKTEGAFFIEMPQEKLTGHKTPIIIEVYSGDKRIDRVTTNFMGPNGPLPKMEHPANESAPTQQ
ncbi:MAG: cytochrome c oxidase accessory protein CcoG [Bacteroidetes bacterium]|nr:cytochrome c oxidase accessory protein CcoG [Bacteroidota bacterium]